MNLGEYIDYYGSLSYEELFAKYREHSDPNVASYVSLEKVNLPEQLISEMCTREPERQPEHLGVKSQYRVKYDDQLQTWAEQTFPHLQFVDVRMQSQPPGEKVPAHLDLLPVYLKKVCNKVPYLRKIKHSIEDPGLDVHQLIIACEDQVEGQVFGFDNPGQWHWTKGDCIRVNTWRGSHWTENNSTKTRHMLKVRGIQIRRDRDKNVFT